MTTTPNTVDALPREQFEKWARERGHDTHRSSGDGYLVYSVQIMWMAFQAGRDIEASARALAAIPAQGAGGVPAGWDRNTEALRQYGEGEEDTGEAEANAMLKSAPERIWLNVDDYPNDHTEFPADHEGITWCTDEIGFKDVPYVRADLAATPSPSAVQPLSEAQRKQITGMWSKENRNYTVSDIIDAVEAAHGIVTKESPDGSH